MKRIRIKKYTRKKKRTNIKYIFLTLSHIKINKLNISMSDRLNLVIRLFNKSDTVNILVVKEDHKNDNDYHYHIIIISTLGLSKNTYKNLYRNIFPEFIGIQLDVQGIKSKNNTFKYVFKNIKVKDVMLFIISENRQVLFSNNTSYWTTIFNNIKEFSSVVTIFSIKNSDNFKDWEFINCYNIHNSLSKEKYIKNLWIKKNELIPTVYTPLINLILKYKDINHDKLIDNFLYSSEKYNISRDHISYLSHLTFGLILRENILEFNSGGFITKGKRLLVSGDPNTGKTRLIIKLRDIFNSNIFYFIIKYIS